MPANELINLYYEGILETSRNNTYFPVVRKHWMYAIQCASIPTYCPCNLMNQRNKKVLLEIKTQLQVQNLPSETRNYYGANSSFKTHFYMIRPSLQLVTTL